MQLVIDSNYGADIDGNRGVSRVVGAEIEDSDIDEILDQLDEYYLDGVNYGNRTIMLYDSITEENHEIEVALSDYYSDWLAKNEKG
jgi:hypothetical protein